MVKLPTVSSKEAIHCFEKLGYVIIRQKGSHVRIKHSLHIDKKPLTVPKHKELGRGLLRKLLRDAEITIDEFNALLKK